MATSVEAKIFDAISRHLSTMAGIPTIGGKAQVALPNWPFAAPATGMWLRLRVQPNQTEQAALGDAGFNRHRGIVQIDVMQRQNAGVLEASELAGAVIAHFRRGTVIDHGGVMIRIEQPPYHSGEMTTDDGWSMTPVTVRYYCDTPNPS